MFSILLKFNIIDEILLVPPKFKIIMVLSQYQTFLYCFLSLFIFFASFFGIFVLLLSFISLLICSYRSSNYRDSDCPHYFSLLKARCNFCRNIAFEIFKKKNFVKTIIFRAPKIVSTNFILKFHRQSRIKFLSLLKQALQFRLITCLIKVFN